MQTILGLVLANPLLVALVALAGAIFPTILKYLYNFLTGLSKWIASVVSHNEKAAAAFASRVFHVSDTSVKKIADELELRMTRNLMAAATAISPNSQTAALAARIAELEKQMAQRVIPTFLPSDPPSAPPSA